VIVLFTGFGVLVSATAAVAVVAAVRAGQVLDRETAPFRWSRLDPAGRALATRLLRRDTVRAVFGFWRAMIPALALCAGVTATIVLLLGLSLGWSGVGAAFSVGGVMFAGASAIGAGVVIRHLCCRDENGQDVPGRFFPLAPVATWFELGPTDRDELGVVISEQQKWSQQEDLDLVAGEVAAVLGRVRDLAPMDLRVVMTTQLVLWCSGTAESIPSGNLLLQQTLRQVDQLLEHLEQDLAEGADEAEARKFWYTAVLRIVRRSAGPRALTGVLESEPVSPARRGGRRQSRAEEGPQRGDDSGAPTESDEPGGETVIDLRWVEQGFVPEPRSHRFET
jgi:hypothetical protein